MLCCRCKKEIMNGSVFCAYCGKRQRGSAAQITQRRRRNRGTGTVFKATGNRKKPFVAVDCKGNFIGYFATSSEAVSALDASNASKLPAERNRWTLQNVYDSFCKSPKYEKIGAKGKEGLASAWPRLATLRGRKAVSITIDEYQDIISAAMKEKRYKQLSAAEYEKLSPAAKARYDKLEAQPDEPLGYDGKNRIKQLISHLYNEMIRLQIVDRNLSDLLVLPPQPGQSKRNFTPEEQQLIWMHRDDETCKIILLYLETGMRLGELLKLKKDAIDFDQNVIVGGSKTEAGRDRTIPLTAEARSLAQYFYSKSDTWLIEQNGGPIAEDTFRRQRFYPALAELGIQYKNSDGKNILTPHRTRHTWVANGISAGMAPEALSKIAGHAKYEVTVDKYADQLDISYLQREMDKLDDMEKG